MPDTRNHRGPDPRDDDAFGPHAWPALRQAVAELSWLLERGYASTSALKLVGDRWSLTERQREFLTEQAIKFESEFAQRYAARTAAYYKEQSDAGVEVSDFHLSRLIKVAETAE